MLRLMRRREEIEVKSGRAEFPQTEYQCRRESKQVDKVSGTFPSISGHRDVGTMQSAATTQRKPISHITSKTLRVGAAARSRRSRCLLTSDFFAVSPCNLTAKSHPFNVFPCTTTSSAIHSSIRCLSVRGLTSTEAPRVARAFAVSSLRSHDQIDMILTWQLDEIRLQMYCTSMRRRNCA